MSGVGNVEYTGEKPFLKYSPLVAQTSDSIAQVTLWTVLNNNASRLQGCQLLLTALPRRGEQAV